jgi:hypothetical protein
MCLRACRRLRIRCDARSIRLTTSCVASASNSSGTARIRLAAQFLHGARDAPARHLGRDERLRLAQHDQILERELPGAARPAPGDTNRR